MAADVKKNLKKHFYDSGVAVKQLLGQTYSKRMKRMKKIFKKRSGNAVEWLFRPIFSSSFFFFRFVCLLSFFRASWSRGLHTHTHTHTLPHTHTHTHTPSDSFAYHTHRRRPSALWPAVPPPPPPPVLRFWSAVRSFAPSQLAFHRPFTFFSLFSLFFYFTIQSCRTFNGLHLMVRGVKSFCFSEILFYFVPSSFFFKNWISPRYPPTINAYA